MIEPSAAKIRVASGRNEVTSAQATLAIEEARCSGGSFGASLGLSSAMIIVKRM